MSQHIPAGKNMVGAVLLRASTYSIPYIENGMVVTYVNQVNNANKTVTISNGNSSWYEYDWNFIVYYE